MTGTITLPRPCDEGLDDDTEELIFAHAATATAATRGSTTCCRARNAKENSGHD